MTKSLPLLISRVRQGRKFTLLFLGASLLALSLTATSPALAAEKVEAKTEKSQTKPKTPSKTTGAAEKTEASPKKTTKTSEVAEKSNAKTSKAKTDDKATKVTASDEKVGSKKTAAKTDSKLADADGKTEAKKKTAAKGDTRRADSDEKPSKDSKAAKSKKTELADADDKATKTKTGKKTEVADKTDSKSDKAKSGSKAKTKLADADDDKPVKGKKSTKNGKSKGKPTKLADASKSKSKKPATRTDKALVAALASAAQMQAQSEQDVAVNSAPLPYAYMKSGAKPSVLNTTDVDLYQTALGQIQKGEFDEADTSLALVTDKSLVGYAQYRKLFSADYESTYDELVAWVNQYGDQPMAMKVWNLAKRKKPEGAPDPAFPSLAGKPAIEGLTADGAGVQLTATTNLTPTVRTDLNPGAPMIDTVDSDLNVKSARSAYNNGQLEQAVTLANKIGDHWVAGLANYRLKRFDQALDHFKFVSTDPSRNAWSQSSGAYWAARTALKMNDPATADTYFKIAASYPFTFYGLLAEARLGVTPAIALAAKGLPPTFQPDTARALAASLDDDFSWTETDARARRLKALVQIGRMSDARDEAKIAIQRAKDDPERQRWTALAASYRLPVTQLKSADRLFNASLYPIPEYSLKHHKVDRALVFAFARKESKFQADVKSYAGAYGLLQIMPGTAALVENDPSFNKKPKQLLDPAVNLRVGQKYIQRLMETKATEGDLLRTIAAYNAGAGPVKDAMSSLGTDADAILIMESIPVAQTRQYVEEVAANYWIYRQLMGKETPSLIQAANDARIIDFSADAGTQLEAEVALIESK